MLKIYSRLLFIFSFIYAQGKDFDVILKLNANEIVEMLTSKPSIQYMNKLAEIFAKTAAESFVKVINRKKHSNVYEENTKQNTRNNRNMSQAKVQDLVEEEVWKLLEDPSPDGDNLEWHSGYNVNDETPKSDKPMPVYGLMKVNGVYVRRLLGHFVEKR